MIKWDKDILSIHITEECNLRCKYCYINNGKRNKQVISKEDIDETLKYIKDIKTIFIYGGEPLLHIDIVKYIIDTYKDKNIVIATNGTLLSEELMEYFIKNSVGIMISLDNWTYIENIRSRKMNPRQYVNIINSISRFDYDKLGIFLTIGEDAKDLDDYFKFAKKYNIQNIETEIAIYKSNEEIKDSNWCYQNILNLPDEVKKLFEYKSYPNTLPKLRLLPNGALTRNHIDDEKDYIEYAKNLKYTNIYENEKFYKETRLPSICKQCEYSCNCSSFNIFPNILNDIEEGNIQNTFACKLTKLYNSNFLPNINRE